MNINLLFSAVIYLLILVVLIYIIKAIIDLKDLNVKGTYNYLKFKNKLRVLKEENKIINNKIVLVEALYETLFNRLFKINSELILIQKLFFDKRI